MDRSAGYPSERRGIWSHCAWCVFCLLSCLWSVAAAGRPVDFAHGALKVSENDRFLVHADGTPFFYLGDTAWELFHRLDREEADRYLEHRAANGYTVIQAWTGSTRRIPTGIVP